MQSPQQKRQQQVAVTAEEAAVAAEVAVTAEEAAAQL